jgi:hypothetical protein
MKTRLTGLGLALFALALMAAPLALAGSRYP